MDGPSTSHPERSLNRQIILDEDEYTAALSHIIARDFFPSLTQLDATNDYLDAVHSGDPHLISASVRRLEEISNTPIASSRRHQTPSQTPYSLGPSDTPLRTSQEETPNKRPRMDVNMSLDTFQARYTSEDNSSFTHILDEENRKRKERWAWAWDAQRRVEGQRDKMIEAREKMLIEAPPATGVREKMVIEAPQVAGLIKDVEDYKEETKEGESTDAETSVKGKEIVIKDNNAEKNPPTDVMAPKKDTRSAGVDGWKFKARNSLMFPPDADESPYHSTVTETTSDPKIIKYGNTRLEDDRPASSSQGLSAPPSPTRSRIEAAISGHPYQPKSSTSKDLTLVPNVPSPTATELGPTAVKQLMTWGTLNASPRIISQSDADISPSTPFHIPAVSSREAISRRLSEKASKSLRAKAGLLGLGTANRTPGIRTPTGTSGMRKKGDMAPPLWTPKRSEAAGNLTPAGRRLLERSTVGTSALRKAERLAWEDGKGKEKDLNHIRWTPAHTPVVPR